jgi:DNA-binding winged helix-turn-helix (wHTH) protein
MNFHFAPFTLSADRAELVGPEGLVAVEPKAFAVLRLLV